MSPLERYPTGVLHPVDPGVSGTDPSPPEDVAASDSNLLDDAGDEERSDGDGLENGTSAQPVRRRRYVPPSSAGFSFCVDSDARLLITASAACYKQVSDRDARGPVSGSGVRQVRARPLVRDVEAGRAIRMGNLEWPRRH